MLNLGRHRPNYSFSDLLANYAFRIVAAGMPHRHLHWHWYWGMADRIHLLAVAAWLVEHGCPINAQNKLGKTAVLVAVENSNDVLAKCLQQLGADVLLRDNTGKSAVDLCRDALKKSLLSQGHLKALCAPHLGPPARGLGLTYLSLHLELLRISKSGRIKGRR